MFEKFIHDQDSQVDGVEAAKAKSEFFMTGIHSLDHIVSANGEHMDPQKIKMIL